MAREISDGGHEEKKNRWLRVRTIDCPNPENEFINGRRPVFIFLSSPPVVLPLTYFFWEFNGFGGFQIGGMEDVTIFVSSFAKNKEGKLVYVCVW